MPVLRNGVLFGQIRKPVLLRRLFCERTEEGGSAVTDELRNKILAFRTAVTLVRSMLVEGIIDSGEFAEIETLLAEKYGLSSSTIFR